MDHEKFIKAILSGAIKAYKKYNILPSLTLAQACIESAWGTYAIGNMLFGIKWQKGCKYDKQLLWTTEFINGKYEKVQDWFRKYNSLADSLEDHAEFLHCNKRYAPVLQLKNYKDACNQIQLCGYATDPNYAQKLIRIIEKNNLQKFDKEEFKLDKLTDVGKAIDFLEEQGILNNKDYWLNATKIVYYLDTLILNFANDKLQNKL